MSCAKAFLYLFNTIYLGISGLLIYVAVWLIQSYKHYYTLVTDTYTVVPAGIIIGVGCLVLLTAIIGCCGTCNENKCSLSFFFLLLFVAFSLEISAGVLGAVYKDEAKEDVHKGLDYAIKHYNNTDAGPDKALDYLQSKLKCCGDNSYKDWRKSKYWQKQGKLPQSCCETEKDCTMLRNHYKKGCYDQLLSKFDDYLTYIIGIGVGFAILQLFGMLASCFVICKSGDVSYAPLNGGTFV